MKLRRVGQNNTPQTREVTKFEFEFDDELQMFSPDSKFDKCFKRFVVKCEFAKKILVLRLISYAQTARECR